MFAFCFCPLFQDTSSEARSEEKGKEKLLYFRKVLRNVVALQEWWGMERIFPNRREISFVGSSTAAKIIQTKQICTVHTASLSLLPDRTAQELRLQDPELRSPDGRQLLPDRRTAIGICGPRLEKRWHLGQLGLTASCTSFYCSAIR